MMNLLTHWDTAKEMSELHRRLASVFDLAPMRRGALTKEEETMTIPDWSPVVDIVEDDKEYLIKVELAGVPKEAVKVVVEGGTLTISGERKSEKQEKQKKYHRVERYYGSFERSFSLPDDADQGKVHAEFRDGVLQVHLTKSEKTQPRQVEVKVS